jgi:RimJ/RimL family protein N-acetyltransferase
MLCRAGTKICHDAVNEVLPLDRAKAKPLYCTRKNSRGSYSDKNAVENRPSAFASLVEEALFMRRVTLQDGREIRLSAAAPNDVTAILGLYEKIYGGKYTLREATNRQVLEEKLEDPNYFWALAHLGDELIGSVIFLIDPLSKIGKAYGAVVLPEFRGQDVMRTMVIQGLERLTKLTRMCDVIYATTRTVSVAPQVVLEHLGFYPMGIFPNVRKVQSYETHGLEVFFRPGTLEIRRKIPQLVPEVVDFFAIVRDLLLLEDHEEIELDMTDPRKMGKEIPFVVSRDEKALLKKYDDYQNRDVMDKVFFPFLEPNLLFSSPDGKAEIFVNMNPTDGHGVIIGYKIGDYDLRRVLIWFSEYASREGMRYIEFLVSAFRPDMQRIALDAKFLPCAYFPAMRMNEHGEREDYVVLSRSFETLDFMNLHLSDTNRRFLDAFMKSWYEMLVRCQPEFDEGWRIG